MIRIRVLVAIAIINIIFYTYCKRSEHTSTIYHIIKNSGDVGKPKLKASFIPIKTIEKDWFDYGSVFFDNEGNIIYWQERDGIVAKFNAIGNQVVKKKLATGQGYGDVNFFDFEEYGGKYYVWDKGSNQRLNIFDKEFNLEGSRDVNDGSGLERYVMHFDSQGNLYFIFIMMHLPEFVAMSLHESGGAYTVDTDFGIGNFGRTGRTLNKSYLKQRYCLYDIVPGKKYLSYFLLQPFLTYIVDDKDYIWVCDRRDYKIYAYSSDGNLENVIEKEYKKILIKGDIEKRFRENYLTKRKTRSEIVFPEYINPVMDILLLNNGRLLVLRMDNMYREDKKGKVLADLLNTKGEFLASLEIPEFSGCYNYNNQFKRNICHKNGHFATLETDDNFEKYRICIYEIRIE